MSRSASVRRSVLVVTHDLFGAALIEHGKASAMQCDFVELIGEASLGRGLAQALETLAQGLRLI